MFYIEKESIGQTTYAKRESGFKISYALLNYLYRHTDDEDTMQILSCVLEDL